MRIKNRDSRDRRRGMMLFELMASVFLLGTVLLLLAQLVAGMAAATKAADRRQWALREASNVMERISAQPWDRLTAEGAAERLLSEADAPDRVTGALPGGTMSLAIEPGDDDIEMLRLTVEVRWNSAGGLPGRPVRLVSWVGRQPEIGGER